MAYFEQTTPTALEWLRSLSTLAAPVLALVLALWGESIKKWFYKPDLQLEAVVRRPDSERVTRHRAYYGPGYTSQPLATDRETFEVWYFRLAITNLKKTPARDVQVYLKKIVKDDGERTPVSRFTPMNLKWANKGGTTREVLLRELPIFCDFIHVSDPQFRVKHGEELNEIPAGKAIMCLDVEATNSAKGHLLGPGAYFFYLYVAAENFPAKNYTVEVRYDGTWRLEQDQMFDQQFGFRMKSL